MEPKVKALLRNTGIFGTGAFWAYLYSMTFKQLANELMDQGWRCYNISDMGSLTLGNNIQSLAIRSLIEVRVYEGKSLVFVRDVYPPKEPKPNPEPKQNMTDGDITD